LFRDLLKRGYKVVPVNPNAAEIENQRCFASVKEITPPPDWSLVMTGNSAMEAVARECLEAGVKRVWLLRGIGDKDARKRAIALIRKQGGTVIDGLCPYLYLSGAGFPHSLHRGILKLFNKLPTEPAAVLTAENVR
jgi:hypothetical protein